MSEQKSEDKFIVTTTINSPSKALKLFSEMEGWTLIVVGDLKTPHEEFRKLNCIYLDPEKQDKKYGELSKIIGWNSIQRRNIGFVEAFHLGASIIATVDDDNIPFDSWGQDLMINREVECDTYKSEVEIFDPLSVTNQSILWHRGFPIELVPQKNNVTYVGKTKRKILVQADLWDGDPDIDAIARLAFNPIVKFSSNILPFCSTDISPFNSQNTFLAREVLPYYSVLPFIGRMDDIWGSYILQQTFPGCVAYNKASVYQERNPQDLIKNLENEIVGYRNTLNLLRNLNDWKTFLPEKTIQFLKVYESFFKP